MSNQYKPGANWVSKDGKRNIVIERELPWGRGRCFAIRNLATNRITNIEQSGLTRKFRFSGYDSAYEATPAPTMCLCVGGTGSRYCPKHRYETPTGDRL